MCPGPGWCRDSPSEKRSKKGYVPKDILPGKFLRRRGVLSPGIGIRVIARLPPLNFGNGKILDNEPAPGPLVAGAEPELAEKKWREREPAEIADLVRKKIFVKRFGIHPVPRLPDFHEPGGLRFEDLEIEREIRVRIIDPPVAHPLSKGPGASSIRTSGFFPRVNPGTPHKDFRDSSCSIPDIPGAVEWFVVGFPVLPRYHTAGMMSGTDHRKSEEQRLLISPTIIRNFYWQNSDAIPRQKNREVVLLRPPRPSL